MKFICLENLYEYAIYKGNPWPVPVLLLLLCLITGNAGSSKVSGSVSKQCLCDCCPAHVEFSRVAWSI